jgi:hypothetical protein
MVLQLLLIVKSAISIWKITKDVIRYLHLVFKIENTKLLKKVKKGKN